VLILFVLATAKYQYDGQGLHSMSLKKHIKYARAKRRFSSRSQKLISFEP
jgi:hypothetical protein